MTKSDFIDAMYAKFSDSLTRKLVTEMVDSMFETMASAIRKEQLFSYPGFGKFVVRRRKARRGRNPQTGEAIKIKASKNVGFKVANAFKEQL
jgi:DNA-binding protein HU-beta